MRRGARPLGQVLTRAFFDFTPEDATRLPWHRERLDRVQHAYTGNVAVVNLAAADRAGRTQVVALHRPSGSKTGN